MRVYIIGFFIAWFLAWCPLIWWQWWGLCLGLLMLLGYYSREYSPGQILLGCGLVWMVALGSHIHALLQAQQLPVYLHKQPVLVSGCYQLVAADQWPLRLRLERPRILSQAPQTEGDKVWQGHAFEASHMHLSVYDAELIKALKSRPKGALVAMAVLKKPHNYQNPGGFDYVRWAQQQGQVARGYIKANLVSWDACQMGLFDIPGNWRQRFLQRLAQVPHDGIGASLWAALAAGHSQGLEGQHWQVLHRTGTTHLLVISGLHIGLVAALLMWFGQRLARLLQCSDSYGLAIWLAWFGALGYAIFSGWGLPAQRAMIMLAAIMLVNRLGVAWNIWQRLLLAWVVTLLLQPNSLNSPGFWYSYLAVANLALVWHGKQADGWSVILIKALVSQLALLAILAPVIAATTGGLSLIGPGLNLILIPLFGLLVVPVLLLGSILLLWLEPTHIIMRLVASALDGLWQSLQFFAAWPYAMLNVGHWPTAVWLLWALLGALLLLCRYYWRAAVCGLLLMLLQPGKAVHQITVFDVGQGLAIWQQSAEQNMLYDLGDRFSSNFNLLQAVVLPSLYQAGVKQLQRVYIGHWDRDHSGGLSALVSPYENLQVAQWWLPIERHQYLEKYIPADAAIQRCHTTDWQTFGMMRIRHLSLQQTRIKGNNASCVVQVDIDGQRVLFAGDIEKVAEQRLVALYGHKLRSDILIAPHHGSRSSSSELFLQTVAPRIVVISAGYQNRYGHPHKQVLQRYWRQGIAWYSTAIHGQIKILVADDGELHVQTYLKHAYN